MITVTLKHGLTKNFSGIEVDHGTTIADLAVEFGPALNLPENWTALINGVTVDRYARVQDGQTIVFEKAATEKGC